MREAGILIGRLSFARHSIRGEGIMLNAASDICRPSDHDFRMRMSMQSASMTARIAGALLISART
jgi:hypothetical protein